MTVAHLFEADTRRTVESSLSAAVASAASASPPIQSFDGIIRHIALFLLPDDDLRAMCRVRELVEENALLREELRLERLRTAALQETKHVASGGPAPPSPAAPAEAPATLGQRRSSWARVGHAVVLQLRAASAFHAAVAARGRRHAVDELDDVATDGGGRLASGGSAELQAEEIEACGEAEAGTLNSLQLPMSFGKLRASSPARETAGGELAAGSGAEGEAVAAAALASLPKAEAELVRAQLARDGIALGHAASLALAKRALLAEATLEAAALEATAREAAAREAAAREAAAREAGQPTGSPPPSAEDAPSASHAVRGALLAAHLHARSRAPRRAASAWRGQPPAGLAACERAWEAGMVALVARGASEVGLGASAGRAERWVELARQARTTVAAANLCPPLSSPSAQPLSSCAQPPFAAAHTPFAAAYRPYSGATRDHRAEQRGAAGVPRAAARRRDRCEMQRGQAEPRQRRRGARWQVAMARMGCTVAAWVPPKLHVRMRTCRCARCCSMRSTTRTRSSKCARSVRPPSCGEGERYPRGCTRRCGAPRWRRGGGAWRWGVTRRRCARSPRCARARIKIYGCAVA